MRLKNVGFALFAISCVGAQDQAPVFRTTAALVLVDVQVLHKRTKTSIGSLQQQDFRIYEDNKLQEIKFISRDRLPLSVVLLFDLTESVRPVLKRLAAGAKTALAHLKPEDEVAVMEYAASARLVDGFTTDRDRTVAAIERVAEDKSDEAAFFNEAVYQAASQLRQAPNPAGRRVVIWLTDNLPNVPAEWIRSMAGKSVPQGALHTEQEAIRALHESGTVVAPLLLKNAGAMPFIAMWMAVEAPWRLSHPPGNAHRYAELTGGRAAGMRGNHVEEGLAELIDDLRSRYTIGYRPSEPKPAGTYCKMRIALSPDTKLRANEWNVLARAGYYRQ